MQYYAERNNIWISLFTEWELFRTPKTSTHSTAPMLLTLTFISPEEFSAENGFISFSKCFFIVFPNSLFCVIFPPAANWHKDGQRVQRGARPISCFSQIFLFSKESCCCCNFQLFEEDPSTKTHSFRRSRWHKMSLLKIVFWNILDDATSLQKNLAHIVININILGKGFQKQWYILRA